MQKINIGDRILVKGAWDSHAYSVKVLAVAWGIFGKYYIGQWTVNDHDYNPPYTYRTIGKVRWWNVLCKVV